MPDQLKKLSWMFLILWLVLSACGSKVTMASRVAFNKPRTVETAVPTPSSTMLPPTAATSTPTPVPTRISTLSLALPDLQTLAPSQLYLDETTEPGRTLLRFTNSIWNRGTGPLELIGHPNETQERVLITQSVLSPDGEPARELEVGEFVFHGSHLHWHMQDFALYEVWSLDDWGHLNEAIRTGRKISFCVIDIYRADENPEDTTVPSLIGYPQCNNERQGLSPGWVDTYASNLPDQWVDVTELVDGTYALVSTVNPAGRILESDFENNVGITYFELVGGRLRIVEAPYIPPDLRGLPEE